MRTKRIFALLLTLVLLTLCVAPAAAAEGEEPEEPVYRATRHIASVTDLQQLAVDCRLDSASEGLLVLLDADLDLSETPIAPIPIFSGCFDGQGHSITGLRLVSDGSRQGLFRQIRAEGLVKDLKLSGEIAPETGRCQVGGLAGLNRGRIENCSFDGSISGLNSVGGLVGENYGTILDCSVSGSVDGKRMTGGVAGLSEGEILRCQNDAQVNTSITEGALQLEDLRVSGLGDLELTNAEDENVVSDSGGIVGLSKGVVRDCVNRAAVGYPHYGYNVGGIAGRQSGYLTGCENRGEIHGQKDVGGIVGQMEPYLLLKESVDMLRELEILNEKMNAVSGTMGDMSEEMDEAIDEIDRGNTSAAGKYNGSGSVSGGDSGDTGESGGAIDGNFPTDEQIREGVDDLGWDVDVPDGLSDDLRTIASGMVKVYSAMSSGTGELSVELTEMNDQLTRVLTLLSNALNGAANRQIFEDVSDEMQEEDTDGRVSGCLQLGSVSGDRNVGGIAGDMGIEYEFDLEGELLDAVGVEGIVSNTYETRCACSDNVDRGTVTARKENTGGIVGMQELGTVLRCENYGSVSCDGDYAGGVAGLSHSVIRQSYAMCDLSGRSYLGGIAGYGSELHDCASIVGVREPGAFCGAIAGWADAEGEALSGNVFVHQDLGGVDGVSYQGKATPVSYAQLLRRQGVPEQFRQLRLSFVADGELVKELFFEYGGSVDPAQVPAVPEKEGYTGDWSSHSWSGLFHSAVIEAVYTPRQGALASKQVRDDLPMAIVMLSGDFESGTELSLREFRGEDPALEEGQVREKWIVQLSRHEEGARYDLRYLPPAVERGHRIDLYVLTDDGWQKVDTVKTGSYLSFEQDQARVVFCAVEQRDLSRNTWILVGACAAAVLLGATVAIVNGRHRKKKAAAASAEEESPQADD